MKVSCVIPVGPAAIINPKYIEAAIKSTEGIYDEIIAVLHHRAVIEGFPSWLKTLVPNLQVIVDHQDGVRIGLAKNVGMSIAQNEWVCTMDADDILIPRGLHIMKMLAEQNEADIIFGQVEEFGEYINTARWPSSPDILDNDESCLPGSALFRHEIWWKLNGFRNVWYEDYEFFIRARRTGFTGFYVHLPYYRHRRWLGACSARSLYNGNLGFNDPNKHVDNYFPEWNNKI